jgi:hypothetical protein
LNKALWAKVKKCADAGGYSSPQEFVEHVLEKELAKVETSASDEEVRTQFHAGGPICPLAMAAANNASAVVRMPRAAEQFLHCARARGAEKPRGCSSG